MQNDHGYFHSFETFEPFAPPPRDLKQDRRQVAVVAFSISFIFLSTLVLQLLLALVIKQFFPSLAEAAGFETLFSTLPNYLIAMPLSLLLYQFAKSDPPTEKKKLSFPVFLGLIAICFAATFLGNLAGTFVATVLEALTGLSFMPRLDNLMLSSPLWVNLLIVGIAAPVMEEIFYRKLVIDRLRGFGELPAILLSALLFGLLHGNIPQFIYATLMGLVFGYIYLYTGKLRYTIALHMTVNLIGGVYTSEILKRLDLNAFAESGDPALLTEHLVPFLMYLAYFAFVCLCMVGALVAVILFWKHVRFQKAQNPPTPRQWVKILLLNPGVWMLLFVVVLLFIPA
jgi:membrane protease YdiL (CAAX protease family)